MSNNSPRWDLSNVYPGLQSAEFTAAMSHYVEQVSVLERLLDERSAGLRPGAELAACASLLGEVVRQFNALHEQVLTLGPYINSFVSTDSHNTLARRLDSELDLVNVRLKQLGTRFQSLMGGLAPVLDELLSLDETVAAHEFALR